MHHLNFSAPTDREQPMPEDIHSRLLATGFYGYRYPNVSPSLGRLTVDLTFGSVDASTRRSYWTAIRYFLDTLQSLSLMPAWHLTADIDGQLAIVGALWRTTARRGMSTFGTTRAALQKLLGLARAGLPCAMAAQAGWSKMDSRAETAPVPGALLIVVACAMLRSGTDVDRVAALASIVLYGSLARPAELTSALAADVSFASATEASFSISGLKNSRFFHPRAAPGQAVRVELSGALEVAALRALLATTRTDARRDRLLGDLTADKWCAALARGLAEAELPQSLRDAFRFTRYGIRHGATSDRLASGDSLATVMSAGRWTAASTIGYYNHPSMRATIIQMLGDRPALALPQVRAALKLDPPISPIPVPAATSAPVSGVNGSALVSPEPRRPRTHYEVEQVSDAWMDDDDGIIYAVVYWTGYVRPTTEPVVMADGTLASIAQTAQWADFVAANGLPD